jgi:hypothetical protein
MITLIGITQMIASLVLSARALYVHEKIICSYLIIQTFFSSIQVIMVRDVDVKKFAEKRPVEGKLPDDQGK